MYRSIICIVCILTLASCNTEEDIIIPSFGKESLLSKAKALDAAAMANTEGIYVVEDARLNFGDSVVLKWNNGKPSIFCFQQKFPPDA